ncbi:hypothetical protein [Streptomyces sp. NPDC048340]|uniref:hypothetical protein n=1 Tax=Streptomyces sp. NPDC048340 TaxID=3365537 RepID=UPI00371C4144
MTKLVFFWEQPPTKGKRMNVTDPYAVPSVNDRQSARLSRRRRNGTAAAITVFLSITLLGCGATGDEPGSKPTASYQETPRTVPGAEANKATKEFHKYLLANEDTKNLTTIYIDVKIEGTDPNLSAQIITGLDHDLRTPDSPDQDKAERLATAFTAWRTGRFKDHGSVKIYNPAAETMATAIW